MGEMAGGAPRTGKSKAEKRKKYKERKKKNYEEMKILLQKTTDMLDKGLSGNSSDRTEWNNHNQSIKALLMRVK